MFLFCLWNWNKSDGWTIFVTTILCYLHSHGKSGPPFPFVYFHVHRSFWLHNVLQLVHHLFYYRPIKRLLGLELAAQLYMAVPTTFSLIKYNISGYSVSISYLIMCSIYYFNTRHMLDRWRMIHMIWFNICIVYWYRIYNTN